MTSRLTSARLVASMPSVLSAGVLMTFTASEWSCALARDPSRRYSLNVVARGR